MKAHFLMMAQYNAWANERLYRKAATLSDDDYRRDAGAFFKSLHGTLNHLMTADRIWMHRLTGTGDLPTKLDAIACEDLESLTVARRQEDERILRFVESLTPPDFEAVWEYKTLNGTPHRQTRGETLAHLFNHQTHHRGQAHGILTAIGVTDPPSLDLLIMQRELSR